MRNPIGLALLVLPFLALANPARAQLGDDAPEHDARVEKLLKELDVQYEIDEDGDFRVLFEMESGRTQLAYVMSTTNHYGNLEIREIWSFGYRSRSETFPAAVATRLLEDTFRKKLGAWAKAGDRAVYVVKISANADSESLMSGLSLALQAADEMEAELSGDRDEF